MAEELETKQISGSIPFFFYDLIGRIVPGAVLILGVLLYFENDLLHNWLMTIQCIFPKDSTAGYALAIVLLFFGVAHLLGVLLGSMSYMVVASPWEKFAPFDSARLKDYLGMADTRELHARFKKLFGYALDEAHLNKASFQCSYYVWRTNPNLGLMTARADAELLSAQNLVFVNLILFLMSSFRLSRHLGWNGDLPWAVCLGLAFFGTCPSFNYMRKKKVFGRFGMFLASTSKIEPTAPGEAAEGV